MTLHLAISYRYTNALQLSYLFSFHLIPYYITRKAVLGTVHYM